MEIGKQIKKQRQANHWTQEELAEKIYVSRQSVSNWENDKMYPDLESLLRMSILFSTTIDDLVKGDQQEMKEVIHNQESKAVFNRDATIFAVLLIAFTILCVPIGLIGKWIGIVLDIAFFAVTMAYALKVEKQKKALDIQSYKEIDAFMQGVSLSQIQKEREKAVRPYQKVFAALIAALIGGLIALLWCLVL